MSLHNRLFRIRRLLLAPVQRKCSIQQHKDEPEGVNAVCEKLDRADFVDLLRKMLALNQDHRITPVDGIQHRFVQMHHIIDYATVP